MAQVLLVFWDLCVVLAERVLLEQRSRHLHDQPTAFLLRVLQVLVLPPLVRLRLQTQDLEQPSEYGCLEVGGDPVC